MSKTNKKIPQFFEDILKDFQSNKDYKPTFKQIGKYSQSIEEYIIDLPNDYVITHPYIIFIIFVHLKKYEFRGIDDKEKWSIPIKYKNIPFLLAHRKFGFRILSTDKDNATKEIGLEAILNIIKAIPFAEALFEPNIKSLVGEGKITLENQYNVIKNRYDFFRKKAISEHRKAYNPKRKVKDDSLQEKFRLINISRKHNIQANNYATAMLDSYYCLIEHTFVLLLPFIHHINIKDISLEEFIGSNWKFKIKKIISLTHDIEAQKIFNVLTNIKEDLRNPLTHGYFLKDGKSFYVHINHVGAVPMNLTKKDNNFHYGFDFRQGIKFEEICKCFDEFDKYLNKNEITKYGMKYIKQSLSVAFDEVSSLMYKEHMSSIKSFNKFINYTHSMEDNASNMD